MNGNICELRKRFCKDEKLPISVFDDPYFEDRLVLMDVLDDWKRFCSMIQKDFHDNPEEYFTAWEQARDVIIGRIKESLAFQAMNGIPSFNPVVLPMQVGQREVYKEVNVGKEFISIDMSKANFSAFVHFGRKYEKAPFYPEYDYEGFIRDCLKDLSLSEEFIQHIAKSKNIRQVVFGNCNPKKQVQYETVLMKSLLKDLLDKGVILPGDVSSINSDEIVLYGGFCRKTLEDLAKEVNAWSKENVPIKMEKYKIAKIDGTQAYLKVFSEEPIISQKEGMIPKCVNPLEAPFVYRFLKGEEFTDYDKIFFYEGRLAKFVEYPSLSLREGVMEENVEKEEEEHDF